MAREAPFGGSFHFLGKGDFKGILLHILEERPMHGYDIMKALEERYHGFYKPSPGSVYPALRALLRQGLVEVTGEERRKTYRLSRKGKDFLKKRKAELEKRFEEFESMVGPERAAMLREMRATGRLLAMNMKTVTPKQAKELLGVLAEMRERIMKIIAK